jgi:hypothetical protein
MTGKSIFRWHWLTDLRTNLSKDVLTKATNLKVSQDWVIRTKFTTSSKAYYAPIYNHVTPCEKIPVCWFVSIFSSPVSFFFAFRFSRVPSQKMP